jgi:glucose-specific phosphotransferase system IIA component
MFGFLKKPMECELYAPVKGKQITLEDVSDQVFAKKMMGEGVAFFPEGDTLYAPCNAEITMIFSTRHAIGLKTENGAEILIHIGMETVNLQGEGFEVLVKPYMKVKTHQPLIKIDREYMREKDIDLTTPMVITNGDEYEIDIERNDYVTIDKIVICVKKKNKSNNAQKK